MDCFSLLRGLIRSLLHDTEEIPSGSPARTVQRARRDEPYRVVERPSGYAIERAGRLIFPFDDARLDRARAEEMAAALNRNREIRERYSGVSP
jgi:hypothetical protein